MKDLNIKNLGIGKDEVEKLCSIEPGWKEEMKNVDSFLKTYEPEVPKELWQEVSQINSDLASL